jgi:hypothetical protein
MVITIRRKHKVEAVRAMFDLLQKGWSIDYPLTEVKTSIESKGAFNYLKGRYTSREGSASSVWMAKMKKDKNNKPDKDEKVID